MAETDFYTDIKRHEFRYIDEVGAKPFLLYKYYLTYSTAPKINPSLETIARDLNLLDKQGKPSKSAVCNLNKVLISKGWIRIENGVVKPLKSFRKSERHSEKMNADHSENLNKRSEKMNDSFRKSERPYKEENKHKEITKKKQLSETSSDVDSPELKSFRKTLKDFQKAYAEPHGKGQSIAQNNSIRKLFELARGDTTICIEIHRFQQGEDWRNGRVTWSTVEKDFNFHKARIEAKNGNSSQINRNGTNGGSGTNNAHLKPRLISG
jgi:hypothetical protein